MRVGLNATSLNNRPSGAKQRFVGIYGALFRRMSETEFVIFEPRDCKISEWFKEQPNVYGIRTPIPSMGRIGKFAMGLGYWRKSFSRQSFDLFEAMHLPLLRPNSCSTILTIHDVRGLYSNDHIYRILFTATLFRALQRADHVITVSEAMRKEILAFYPYTPVSVVYNGLNIQDDTLPDASACTAFLDKYQLPSDYILAVGHLEKRKNYAQLINAIFLLKQRGLDCSLVIVGNDSGEGADLLRQIDLLGLTKQVKLLSCLSDTEVRCAYSTASLFVFPSVYEGFGIPILEAMAAGCPMVLSDIPVFREISEGQAIYSSPDDPSVMADSIEIGLTSTSIRNNMITYGERRVLDFSYERLAIEVTNVYDRCR